MKTIPDQSASKQSESSKPRFGLTGAFIQLALLLAAPSAVRAQLAAATDGASEAPAAETESATAQATGSGTTNHLARWTNGTTLGESIITQIQSKIGIGDPNPATKLSVKGADPSLPTIRGTNTSSGKGVAGASASGTGVSGTSTSGIAVQGSATGPNNPNAAVFGETSSTSETASGVTGRVTSANAAYSAGVRGEHNGQGSGWGVEGIAKDGAGVYGHIGEDSGGAGVYGVAKIGRGVYGISISGIGVEAQSTSGVGVQGGSDSHYGVRGGSNSSAGVVGLSISSTGVAGDSSSGSGVTGQSTDGYGVYGTSTNSYAGYFDGNVHVNGTLSKSAGSFQIDHPLDPEHKNLSHSFVESPDMMNIYNGNAELDEHGEATVQMPDYFAALNQDYRYQLTAVEAAAPNLHVAQRMKGNEFKISGGQPGMTVSWQVTGVRHDAYANAHRIAVESPKSPTQIGHYLNPEAFGQPAELAIGKPPFAASGSQELEHVAAK